MKVEQVQLLLAGDLGSCLVPQDGGFNPFRALRLEWNVSSYFFPPPPPHLSHSLYPRRFFEISFLDIPNLTWVY